MREDSLSGDHRAMPPGYYGWVSKMLVPGLELHTYNPSYLGGRHRRITASLSKNRRSYPKNK
jgi:hypothetical protein